MDQKPKSTGKRSSSSSRRRKGPVVENPPPARLADAPRPITPIRPRKSTRINEIFDDTPLIIAFRHFKTVNGGRAGWQEYVKYVEFAARNGDEDMHRFFRIYQAFDKKEKAAHSPEQICELANVKPEDLIAQVCRSIWLMKSHESSMISAIAQPVVMERIAREANKPGGNRDRELFLRATGSLPDKKGAAIGPAVNIQINQAGAGGGMPGKTVDILPTMDEDMVETTRQLSAPEDLAENVIFMRPQPEKEPVQP